MIKLKLENEIITTYNQKVVVIIKLPLVPWQDSHPRHVL